MGCTQHQFGRQQITTEVSLAALSKVSHLVWPNSLTPKFAIRQISQFMCPYRPLLPILIVFSPLQLRLFLKPDLLITQLTIDS